MQKFCLWLSIFVEVLLLLFLFTIISLLGFDGLNFKFILLLIVNTLFLLSYLSSFYSKMSDTEIKLLEKKISNGKDHTPIFKLVTLKLSRKNTEIQKEKYYALLKLLSENGHKESEKYLSDNLL